MDVTFLTTQFKVKEIVQDCIESIRAIYPEVPLVVVDDGSRDASTEYLRELANKDKYTLAIASEDNLGQGDALHLGISHIDTPYVFTLHADTETQRGGFLEEMLERFLAEPNLFAIGHRVPVHKIGPLQCVWPTAMMMDLVKYSELSPFKSGGLPCVIPTMIEAQEKGYLLEDFPIFDYIEHKGTSVRSDGGGTIRKAIEERIISGEISREDWDRMTQWKNRFRGYFE